MNDNLGDKFWSRQLITRPAYIHAIITSNALSDVFWEQHLDKLGDKDWIKLTYNRGLSSNFWLRHLDKLPNTRSRVSLILNPNLGDNFWETLAGKGMIDRRTYGLLMNEPNVSEAFWERRVREGLSLDPDILRNPVVSEQFLRRHIDRFGKISIVRELFENPSISEQFALELIQSYPRSRNRMLRNRGLPLSFFETHFDMRNPGVLDRLARNPVLADEVAWKYPLRDRVFNKDFTAEYWYNYIPTIRDRRERLQLLNRLTEYELVIKP